MARGFTVSFPIVIPAITIGLASYLAVLEGLWLWRKDTFYRDLYHFWSKIFGLLGFLLDAGARGLHRMFGRNR